MKRVKSRSSSSGSASSQRSMVSVKAVMVDMGVQVGAGLGETLHSKTPDKQQVKGDANRKYLTLPLKKKAEFKQLQTKQKQSPETTPVQLDTDDLATVRLLQEAEAAILDTELNSFNSHAMRIVRTVGQAFEVCHKLSVNVAASTEEGHEAASEKSSDDTDQKNTATETPSPIKPSTCGVATLPVTPVKASPEKHLPSSISTQDAFRQPTPQPSSISITDKTPGTIASPTSPPLDTSFATLTKGQLPVSTHHQIQLLGQQLQQQEQQTQVAMAQMQLLKDQLSAETAARVEAQARTHQLLVQNRDLLEHVNALVGRLQLYEMKTNGVPSEFAFKTPTQGPLLPNPITPEVSAFSVSGLPDIDASLDQSILDNLTMKSKMTDSPDSGHKEMSSDSLSRFSLVQGDSNTWYTPMSGVLTGRGAGACSFTSSTSSSGIGSGSGSSSTERSHLNLPLTPSTSVLSTSDSNTTTKVAVSNKSSDSSTGADSSSADNSKLMILPMPSQDASGNRLDLTPRIHPPPKVKRNSSRLSGGVVEMGTISPGNPTGTPVFVPTFSPTSPDANGNSALSPTPSSASSMSDKPTSACSADSSKVLGGTSFINNGAFLDDPFSPCSKNGDVPNNVSFQAIKENEKNTSNSSYHSKPATPSRPVTANNQTTCAANNNNNDNTELKMSPAQQLAVISPKSVPVTKTRLSFSDEENTNSEDSGIPLHSKTFEELEALTTS